MDDFKLLVYMYATAHVIYYLPRMLELQYNSLYPSTSSHPRKK